MPTVYSLPWFYQQFCDRNGVPLAAGYIETKAAGTNNDKATYSDAEGTTANANSVVLDAAGMCLMFLQAGPYDFYVYDVDDNLIRTIEGINSLSSTINVDSTTELSALAAGETTIVQTNGRLSVNDGGGWWYYWDATSTALDDGGGVIQPDSLPATGRWLAMLPPNREMNVRVFGATCDGTTDDIDELTACDNWCAANSCTILVDSNIYFSTDPSLASKIKLLPDAQLRWGTINPVLDVVIDGNDKTQHFNCAAAYVPTLNVNELFSEWFGETALTSTITAAAISAISSSKLKYTKNGYVENLSINDAGTKIGLLRNEHYTAGEESVSAICCASFVSNSTVYIGGGLTSLNAATNVDIYAAANNTTLTGTKQVGITSDGVVVGGPTGGAKGAGTINATAVYDDNVLLTGYVLDKAFNPDFNLEDWKKKTPVPAEEFNNRSDMLLNVDKYNEFIESRKMLPTFEDVESTGNIPSTGAMIQKLWEVVEIQAVHIKQLNDKLNKINKFGGRDDK